MRLATSLWKAGVFVGFAFRTKASIASRFTIVGHTVKTSASKPSIANISIVLTEAAEAISGFGLRTSDFGLRDFGTSDFGLRVFGISDFGFRDFSFRKVSEKKVQFFAFFRQKTSFPDILLNNRYVTHFPITFRQGPGGEGARRRGGFGRGSGRGGEARSEGTLFGRRVGSSGRVVGSGRRVRSGFQSSGLWSSQEDIQKN